jgi:sec-independent protein translocase protein TatA
MFRNPTTDLIVVLLIVLLIFGPKRLPGLGKQLGQGIREFKDSITGNDDGEDAERPAIAPSTATAPTAPPPPAATPAVTPAQPASIAERESSEVGSEQRP